MHCCQRAHTGGVLEALRSLHQHLFHTRQVLGRESGIVNSTRRSTHTLAALLRRLRCRQVFKPLRGKLVPRWHGLRDVRLLRPCHINTPHVRRWPRRSCTTCYPTVTAVIVRSWIKDGNGSVQQYRRRRVRHVAQPLTLVDPDTMVLRVHQLDGDDTVFPDRPRTSQHDLTGDLPCLVHGNLHCPTGCAPSRQLHQWHSASDNTSVGLQVNSTLHTNIPLLPNGSGQRHPVLPRQLHVALREVQHGL